ncbi:MAG TPA: carbohydrate kinase family protein [Candidatus Paceibacterota bacterium]|nr:carbohydrate kinase family protein [Candidatus Paceibacterota bacterium]
MQNLDFLAIGDTVVDDFILLKDAKVHCDVDTDACTISMRWGDKIPFVSSTIVAGVGNSANAAVSAARLGLNAALMATVGDDRDGEAVMEHFDKERLSTALITRAPGKSTNHHYVLSYESERTILVKPEPYDYVFPMDLPAPKTVYLSSLGEAGEQYYADMAAYLNEHPAIFFTFQPGTFQMNMGVEKLTPIYRRADLLVVNKEEAERILKLPSGQEINALLEALRALGPKHVIITDGREGAYAFDGERTYRVPMYPDDRAPFERTGAGDAFASTITAAITMGLPFSDALLWGPVNSMSVVQEVGAQAGLLTRAKLEEYLQRAPAEYLVTSL